MKRITALLLSALMLLAMTACSSPANENTEPDKSPGTQEETPDTASPSAPGTTEEEPDETTVPDQTADDPSDTNVLIVYFSKWGITPYPDDVDATTSASIVAQDDGRYGNTEVIANMIQLNTSGEVFQIITAEQYPVDYRDTTDLARQEQNSDARPELTSHVENMEDYDIVFLGYPNWWGTIPMAMYTFLEEYDFSGKTIIPFCTHEGSGLGSGPDDIASLCPDATIADGFAVRGNRVSDAAADVEEWLSDLGIFE